MRSALILVALLGLGACADSPPPAAVAPPAGSRPTATLEPEFERAHLAECAKAQATIAKANDVLARQGSAIRVDLDRTPCTAPTPDSGVRYAKPTPPRVSVTCRSWRFKSSGNSTTTCTSG